MYTKVLIISDNASLCNKFKQVVKDLSLDTQGFTFATSPYSNSNDFGGIKVLTYDLKIESNVNYIISNYDLVFSIHCKQIFPKPLVKGVKCINIHPGYNPINRGWYPQVFSIINDLPIGATIHEIDEQLDHGGVIVRELVEKFSYDTSETLYNRILEKEVDLLYRYLPSILNKKYDLISPEDEGNLYLKKDFNKLLEIDLQEEYKAGDLINRLRALTHGAYKNAYFIDKETGDKIYIGIQLNKEN